MPELQEPIDPQPVSELVYENDDTKDFTWTTDPVVKRYQRKVIQQAISDGSLNPRILGKFFDDLKLRSYTYDYNLQRDLVNLQQTRIYVSNAMNHMIKGAFSNTFDRVLEFTIPIQFTNPKVREQYKRNTSIFRKYLTPNEICSNKNYFRYNLLIMAGNKILTNYRARAYNNRIDIAFLYSDFDKDITDMNVYFLPDSVVSVMENVSSIVFTDTSLAAVNFNNCQHFKKIHNYLAFWIDKETQTSYMIPSVTYDPVTDRVTINDMLPTDLSKYKLMLIGIENLFEISDFNGSVDWMEYTEHKMPLPKDNLIVFVYKDGTYVPNNGDLALIEYYPNLYRVENPNGYSFRLLELYEENSENEHIVYDNEVKRYMQVMNINGFDVKNLSKTMLEYKPVKWDYDLLGLVDKYPYHELDIATKKEAFLYRMYALSTMMKHWYMLYDEYQRRTYGFLTGWYHNMAKYTDNELLAKTRRSTAVDVDNDIDFTFEFPEMQFVFTYVNNTLTGHVNSFCFFVDGRYTIPTKILVYKGYQYVYFPCSLVHRDSIIEVERFDANSFQYRTKVNQDDNILLYDTNNKKTLIPTNYETIDEDGNTKVLTPVLHYLSTDGSTEESVNNVNVTKMTLSKREDTKLGTIISLSKLLKLPTVANNLFLVTPEGEFLNHGEFDTYVIDPELGEVKVDLEKSVFIVSKDCKLRIVPVNFTGTYVMLCCNDVTYQYVARETGDDFYKGRDVNLNERKYITNAEQDISHRLRIFYNGRLIPKRSYQVYKYKNYFDAPKFNIPIRPGEDIRFLVSYIGYDERLIYHREKISANGYINMEGKISRPINLTYHDIYLDGYRLTKFDIDQLTPFSFIIKKETLEKYDTLLNLEVYEKVHIPDYYIKFDWSELSDFIMDKLLHEDEIYFHQVINTLDEIKPSGNTKDIDLIRDWFYSFFADYLPYHYMSGDTRLDLEAYHHIFDDNGRVLLNADDRIKYIKSIRQVFHFNHDKTLDTYGIDPANYPKPLKEDMEETTIEPDDSIKVPEEQYRQYGYTEDGFDRVYDTEIVFKEDDKTRTTIDPNGVVRVYKLYNPDEDARRTKFKSHMDENLQEYTLDEKYDSIQEYATNYYEREGIDV